MACHVYAEEALQAANSMHAEGVLLMEESWASFIIFCNCCKCMTHTLLVMQREALRAANMLHAEGVLLMEEARAAAAAILALRDNTARPLMAAGPVFLNADGSRAFASSLRAGLGSGLRIPHVARAARVRPRAHRVCLRGAPVAPASVVLVGVEARCAFAA